MGKVLNEASSSQSAKTISLPGFAIKRCLCQQWKGELLFVCKLCSPVSLLFLSCAQSSCRMASPVPTCISTRLLECHSLQHAESEMLRHCYSTTLTSPWGYNQLRLHPVWYNQHWLQQLGNMKYCLWPSNLQKVTQSICSTAGSESCSFNSGSSS